MPRLITLTTGQWADLPLARLVLILLTAVSLSCVPASRAANPLTNPGFELLSTNGNSTVMGWQMFGANHYNLTSATIAHSGTNYLKVYQGFTGVVNLTGVYQDYISGPGAIYSADGWAYTAANDALAGQNIAWIEISFRDALGSSLALYRSSLITTNAIAAGAFPKSQWNHLDVTNQYDPGSLQLTNTVTQLIAPPGTFYLRYRIVFQGDASSSSGSVYFDDLDLERVEASTYGDLNIVWSDEFDGAAIKTNIWTYELGGGGWGNNELEYYTNRASNSFVTNGQLHIVARQQTVGSYNYTSARMKSEGLFSFTYGRLEWRARFPSGVGFWPALWLLGTNISSIGWPKCGEIDVFENTGTNTVMVQSSIHSGSDGTGYFNFINDAITNFHTYTFDWTTNAMLFYVDGHLYETQTSWSSAAGPYPFPFNKPFFLIMNLAIGGNYVGNPTKTDIDTHSIFPAEILVDYVRLYSSTAPLRLAIEQAGTNLLLSWPSNIVAHLEAQTNSTPAGLGSNWYPIAPVTNPVPINPTAGSAYFRLTSP